MDALHQKRPSVVASIAERLGSDDEDDDDDDEDEVVQLSPDGQTQYTRRRRWWHQGRAKSLILMLSSTLITSIYMIFAKKITSVSSAELVTINLGFSCIPSAIILAYCQINPLQFGRQWGIDVGCLVVRAVLGIVVDIVRVIALKYLPIGDCSTIMFSNPILVALVAPLVLKERLLCSTLLAVGLTIVGITLVSQPTFLFSSAASAVYAKHNRNTGILLALTSAVAAAVVLIAVRALKRVNAQVIMLWAGVIGFVGSLAVTLIMEGGIKMPASSELVVVMLAAVFQYAANLTMIMAFQHDAAARMASVRTTVVVWSYVWQVIVFADPVSWLSIIGAVFVIIAVVIVSSTRDHHHHHTEQDEPAVIAAVVDGNVEQQTETKVWRTFQRDAPRREIKSENNERSKLLRK